MEYPKLKSEEELRNEWTITAKDHVGSRMVFFFGSKDFPDVVTVKIAVSRTHRNPESEAWRVLGETVK